LSLPWRIHWLGALEKLSVKISSFNDMTPKMGYLRRAGGEVSDIGKGG
jgi:hypothetical protein